MIRFLSRWSRKLHRWGAIISLLPLLLVIITGLVLMMKKDVAWVQPPTQRGIAETPTLSFAQILVAASRVSEAQIDGWDDIDRLDVRPGKGVVKVRGKNHWEVQLDSRTGCVLSSQPRRSDLIEALHDGSWFGDEPKTWIFLTNGVVLLGLLISGFLLWILPIVSRRRKARTGAAEAN